MHVKHRNFTELAQISGLAMTPLPAMPVPPSLCIFQLILAAMPAPSQGTPNQIQWK